MAHVELRGRRKKITLDVQGKRVVLHYRTWKDARGKVRRTLGGKFVEGKSSSDS